LQNRISEKLFSSHRVNFYSKPNFYGSELILLLSSYMSATFYSNHDVSWKSIHYR